MAISTDTAPQASASGNTTETEVSLLDKVIKATKQTEPSVVKDLLGALVEQAQKGIVRFERNLPATFSKAIAAIDEQISLQLNAIMHDAKFQALEGKWRGLNYLVSNSETGGQLEIKLLQLSQREISREADRTGGDSQQGELFQKIYESAFGTAGGIPFAALIGDYQFGPGADDITSLRYMSGIAAASFAPFISAPTPQLLGIDTFEDLSVATDLETVFKGAEFTAWRGFRETDDARFVSLVMPRVLSRVPYGSKTKSIEEFNYEEAPLDKNGNTRAMAHDQFCWMSAAYVMGARLTDAFARTGFCTAIRGYENGGKVEGLPSYVFTTDHGDKVQKCPTETSMTDRREAELSKLGFIGLSHYKDTDYAVFFSGQSTQKPRKMSTDEATANYAISTRLPYLMATSRFAHCLKVMGRDKVGSYMEAKNTEDWLNDWIRQYVNADDGASAESKLKFPLRYAKVDVVEDPSAPGSYNAVATLRPWLQMEELTAALSLVAAIPQKN